MVVSKNKVLEFLFTMLVFVQMVNLLYYSNAFVDKISISLTVLLMFLTLIVGIGKINKNYCFIGLVNLFSLVYTFISHSGIGVFLLVCTLLLSIIVFNNVGITLFFYRRLHFIVALMLCYYVTTVDLSFIYAGFVYDVMDNKLNVNMWGLLILASILHFICYYDGLVIKAIPNVILTGSIVIWLSYLLLISRCRTVMIAYITFLVLRTITKNHFSYRKYRRIVTFILLSSLLFPLFYILLYGMVDNFTVLGKSIFTGRQIVWLEAINQYLDHPIFGSGNDFLMLSVQDKYTQSAHNMLLGMLKMCGIIPTITIIFFMVNRLNKNVLRTSMLTAQIAFISSLVCCFFESFLMDSHLCIFFLLFLLSNIKNPMEFENDT